MNAVIVQVSLLYTDFWCRVKFLCLLSIAFMDHVTTTLYEDVLRPVWCCLVSPIGFVCVSKSGMPNYSSLILIATLHLGGRNCVVGFE